MSRPVGVPDHDNQSLNPQARSKPDGQKRQSVPNQNNQSLTPQAEVKPYGQK